jgi:hypothetical protein
MSQCLSFIPQVASMMTVGPGIADAYERAVGVRASVVTNAPAYVPLEPTPVHAPVRVLHHGGAQPGRGLEEMIRVAELLDDRFTVDFVLAENKAGYREKLMRAVRDTAKVRFPPPRPMHELTSMANDYDIGLYLLPPTNFNQSHALPNKLFEFVQGRLAVAIGPSPEMEAIVGRFNCGIVADDFEPETLAAALNALDAKAIAEFKRASGTAARELCAERNAEVVLSVVERAVARAPRHS